MWTIFCKNLRISEKSSYRLWDPAPSCYIPLREVSYSSAQKSSEARPIQESKSLGLQHRVFLSQGHAAAEARTVLVTLQQTEPCTRPWTESEAQQNCGTDSHEYWSHTGGS